MSFVILMMGIMVLIMILIKYYDIDMDFNFYNIINSIPRLLKTRYNLVLYYIITICVYTMVTIN